MSWETGSIGEARLLQSGEDRAKRLAALPPPPQHSLRTALEYVVNIAVEEAREPPLPRASLRITQNDGSREATAERSHSLIFL